ncbi:alpha-ketoglutarate-dependent dioxygenase AlkB [Flexibacterium corallicola]|uniref:alpha-ketoglutarate-dependent dioxygenase AlkB n=1 Tax=Flexibacterium corallicola TaxID=3037259 RepID=UPI00286ED1CB|nr:alpha-ketoglutarate-dependent dioxygenase AlkB [Pseudovibrio sp. M1P-2-3]
MQLPEGLRYLPDYFNSEEQKGLVERLRQVTTQAPLFQPLMPQTGKPFSVRMTNCGPLGWVSDRAGYRYQNRHPVTNKPWPDIPEMLLRLWKETAQYPALPEACLINFYGADAKMGMHRDSDEADLTAPVVSVSLGDTAVFRIGGENRRDATRSFKLRSGDVVILGGKSRNCYHGIDHVITGTSRLLKNSGRINTTLRRVT